MLKFLDNVLMWYCSEYYLLKMYHVLEIFIAIIIIIVLKDHDRRLVVVHQLSINLKSYFVLSKTRILSFSSGGKFYVTLLVIELN